MHRVVGTVVLCGALFAFVYMTVLAYVAALITFQVGRLITDWTM